MDRAPGRRRWRDRRHGWRSPPAQRRARAPLLRRQSGARPPRRATPRAQRRGLSRGLGNRPPCASRSASGSSKPHEVDVRRDLLGTARAGALSEQVRGHRRQSFLADRIVDRARPHHQPQIHQRDSVGRHHEHAEPVREAGAQHRWQVKRRRARGGRRQECKTERQHASGAIHLLALVAAESGSGGSGVSSITVRFSGTKTRDATRRQSSAVTAR